MIKAPKQHASDPTEELTFVRGRREGKSITYVDERAGIRMLEKIHCKDCTKHDSVTMFTGWLGCSVYATLRCKECHSSYMCRKTYPEETPQENYLMLQREFEISTLRAYRDHKKTKSEVRGIYGTELKLLR